MGWLFCSVSFSHTAAFRIKPGNLAWVIKSCNIYHRCTDQHFNIFLLSYRYENITHNLLPTFNKRKLKTNPCKVISLGYLGTRSDFLRLILSKFAVLPLCLIDQNARVLTSCQASFECPSFLQMSFNFQMYFILPQISFKCLSFGHLILHFYCQNVFAFDVKFSKKCLRRYN